MNQVFRPGWLLTLAVSCTPVSPSVQAPSRLVSSEELAVIQAVIQTNELLVDHQLFGQALWARPLFTQVLPLAVRPNSPVTRDTGFAVLVGDLLRHTYLVQGQPLPFFSPADSSVLLTQRYAAPRLLDSTQFAPCDLLTLAHYQQLRQRNVGSHYHGRITYQLFSQPLFSADKTKAYLQLEELGFGRTEHLLVKKGLCWEQVGSSLLWVE